MASQTIWIPGWVTRRCPGAELPTGDPCGLHTKVTGFVPLLHTGGPSYGAVMETFTIALADGSTAQLSCDAYQQEGSLTTFFSVDSGRQVIDSWSVRLASYRTNDIVSIRRDGSPVCGRQRELAIAS